MDESEIEIPVRVTHLEMLARPARPRVDLPENVRIERAHPVSIRFYRYVYDAVGSAWLWVDRKRMSDEDLASIVHDPKVEVHVLWIDGSPAGYAELDLRAFPDIELAYFGLMPEYFGRGFGRFFLSWAIDEAFDRNPSRFWVHTCELDHHAALSNYERCGFAVFKTETIGQLIPRSLAFRRSE